MKGLLLSITLILLTLPTLAETRLPSIIGNHMVLQRDRPVHIWGWDDPGEKVTVQFGNQKVSDIADENGRWDVQMESMPASFEGRNMRIRGSSKIKLVDILVGEVWHCSGQSNIQYAMVP